MSLFRIPLLLLNAGGLLVSLAFPMSPPPIIELRYTKRRTERFLQAVLPGVMMSTSIVFVLEALIITLSQIRGPTRRLASILMLSGTTDSLHTTPSYIIGTTLLLMASILRYASYDRLGRLYTPSLTIRKNHQLVIEGPYAVVRHPGYTAWLITELALLLTFSSSGCWLTESGVLDSGLGMLGAAGWLVVCMVADTMLVVKRVPREEGLLKKEFGKEWSEYKKKVPWKFVPGVY